MKRVVITGATGFIGIHLIKEWLEKDVEVFAVIRPNSKNAGRIPQNDHIHIIEQRMDEYDTLPRLIDSADYFYHLAWEGARVPFRDDTEMQKNNYKCTLMAYESAKKLGCSFFLGSGSQAEYGPTNGIIDETYPCNPTSEYGKQKLEASKELLSRAEHDGMKLIWTRLFSIYGPHDFQGTLVMSSIDKMLKDEPIKMTEGTQLWDYLYVSDAAAAMILFSEVDCDNGVYNIASGNYKPLKSFVEEIKRILNSKSKLEFGAIHYGPYGPVNLMPDSSKLRALGWKSIVSFNEGIRFIVREMALEI